MKKIAASMKIALRALRVNRMRSALTMLGIIIGVASVVALMAIGNGAQVAITSQISSIGSNLLTVFPGQQRRGPGPAAIQSQGLTLADAEALVKPGALPAAVTVAPIFQRLNREQGITMIVVTHEPDIAAYANRNIHFKDGVLQLDERIAHPREAQKELEEVAA